MGSVTRSEEEEKIQNVEELMENAKVNLKEKVKYASQNFIREANTAGRCV